MIPPSIQNPKSRIQNRLLFCVLCISAVNLLGCQTDKVTTSDGWRMPPEPRATPQPPPTLRADTMAFTVGSKPDDTNNNGFPDSIQVSVSLFSTQHPTALRQEGAFVFEMYRQGEFGASEAKPMLKWRKEPEAVKQAEARTLAGPCYLFQLSLLDFGTDRIPLDRADLVCRFEPADGSPPVRCEGVRTIQIGRR